MKRLTMFTTVAVLALAFQARAAETVKLKLEGIHWNGCGGVVAMALGQVPSVKIIVRPTKAKPIAEVTIDPARGDVGDLAKLAAKAKTPHVSQGAPSASLIVEAKGLTEANAEKVADALKGVAGVDAKASKADPKTHEILVKLDDKGGAKLADIKKALDDYIK